MWKPACRLPANARRGRIGRPWGSSERRSFSRSPGILSRQPPTSGHAARAQVEQEKRRKEKEKAILNAQHSVVDGHNIKWTETERIVYAGATLPGEKKDTTLPFPASYSPQYVEACWYQWWEKKGFFSPELHSSLPHAVDQSFSMCIPPPNVTGSLHLGHALTVAIQDALVRCRITTFFSSPALYLCVFVRQSVVERRLLWERGRRRQDYSREEFLQEVWNWKNEKGDEIYHQLRKLGASLDWSRACFTMDPDFSSAVTEAFVRLCDSGLVYRSEGLVNWSCALGSAISDIEARPELRGRTLLSIPGYEQKVEFGSMIAFVLSDGEISVSTTRPETMMGDVAIAVHPDDPRYQALHGRECRHPFTGRLMPVVTDTVVDMSVGTGAVKVTPAHDQTDFLLSQRHSLPRITVIGEDGTMTSSCGPWLEGVKRFEARERVLEALVEKQMFKGKMEHPMALPVCSRSGDVIEPLLKKQWFLRCGEMAKKAVDDGELELIPHLHHKTWRNWLSSISDWCISRQLWWGHQIPAYRVSFPGSTDADTEQWVWGKSEAEASERAAAKFGVTPDAITLTRDPDVLDTWFSSALFPFAMLGWPQKTADLQQFYPNSLLETGSDLIFFWVARMVMLGTELTGQLPFRQVLLHSLVRDKHGRKMSKSLGNVIDPLDVISGVSLQRLQEKVKEGNLDPRETAVAMEAQRRDFPSGIPECGTDALRFALCSYKAQGEDISLSVSQVLSSRHFCNKMWQTVRFALGVLEPRDVELLLLAETVPVSSVDRWLCSRMYSTVQQCERGFENYDLLSVTSALYSFWVHNLCDVYLVSKMYLATAEQRVTARSVLFHCLTITLSLLAPFMPFLTEELWQRLQPHAGGKSAVVTSLCLQPYPRSSQLTHWYFPQEEADFPFVQDVIRVARTLRSQCCMTKAKPDSKSCVNSSLYKQAFRSHCFYKVRTHTDTIKTSLGLCIKMEIYFLQGNVGTDKQSAQLSQRRQKLLSKLEQLQSRTRMPHYAERVPQRVRQETENRVSCGLDENWRNKCQIKT
uniref:Valine--tRNA ligase, mitochondrial n=1 Tax=Scleropages formosus TaxID=113540 RepID=A0A8C9U0C9_SCLFO